MDQQDLLSLFVNAILFWIAFKIGQVSMYIRLNPADRDKKIQSPVSVTIKRNVITVEEINGIFYAYDGNDFLAQGNDPDELSKRIVARFPDKYVGARIQMRV